MFLTKLKFYGKLFFAVEKRQSKKSKKSFKLLYYRKTIMNKIIINIISHLCIYYFGFGKTCTYKIICQEDKACSFKSIIIRIA